jgi:hypothetical protein
VKRRRDPVEGDVYVKENRHRRVIGVLGGGIVYSVGADKNRVCLVATFKRWARHAQLVHGARNALGAAP